MKWLSPLEFERENYSDSSEVVEVVGVDRWGRSYVGPAYYNDWYSRWTALEDRLVNRRVWVSKIRQYEETSAKEEE